MAKERRKALEARKLIFLNKVFIKLSCQASRALEAEINTKCAVELAELWGPEIDAFQSSGGPKSTVFSIEVLIKQSCQASKALKLESIQNVLWSF